jgi:excisionase family DNA binding protein
MSTAMMSSNTEPMMTAEEVAAFLKVSLSMVYKLRREARLPGVQVGALWRFAPEVVRAFSRGELPPPSGGAPVVSLGARRRRV